MQALITLTFESKIKLGNCTLKARPSHYLTFLYLNIVWSYLNLIKKRQNNVHSTSCNIIYQVLAISAEFKTLFCMFFFPLIFSTEVNNQNLVQKYFLYQIIKIDDDDDDARCHCKKMTAS